VEVGCIADVLEEYAASIFRIDVIEAGGIDWLLLNFDHQDAGRICPSPSHPPNSSSTAPIHMVLISKKQAEH
jgi:hypothetical protein